MTKKCELRSVDLTSAARNGSDAHGDASICVTAV